MQPHGRYSPGCTVYSETRHSAMLLWIYSLKRGEFLCFTVMVRATRASEVRVGANCHRYV